MIQHRFRRAALALALLPVLASLPVAAAQQQPYVVNVVLPMSGVIGFYGASMRQTLKAVENYVNRGGGIDGHPVQFAVQDDQSNAQLDLQLVSQLVSRNAPLLLGPTNTTQCNAVSPLVKTGPVTYCFNPGVHPAAGSYVFSFGPSTESMMDAIFNYIKKRGITRVAVISSTDAGGQDGERMLVEAAQRAQGVTLAAREHFNPADLAVDAQITRIKAVKPQLLIVWTNGTLFGTVLHGIQQTGFEGPVLTTNGNLTYAEMRRYASILPKELIFPGGTFQAREQFRDPAQREAIDTFYRELRLLGEKPDWGHNIIWDPALILVHALRKVGPGASAQQLHDYLVGLKGFVGVNGRYDFTAVPQRGVAENAVVMVRWDAAKGDFVAISRPAGEPLLGAKSVGAR